MTYLLYDGNKKGGCKFVATLLLARRKQQRERRQHIWAHEILRKRKTIQKH